MSPESVILTVVLKDSETTVRKKFLLYERVSIDSENDDPVVMRCIEETKRFFQGTPEKINVTTKLVNK